LLDIKSGTETLGSQPNNSCIYLFALLEGNAVLFGNGVLAVPLSEPDGLAGSLAEEIQFRASCFAASNWYNIHNIGRMKWEDSLHAFVSHNSPHRESFVNAATLAGNYRAGEYLSPLFVAFLDSAVHINHVAYFKMWYIFFEAFTFDSIQHFRLH